MHKLSIDMLGAGGAKRAACKAGRLSVAFLLVATMVSPLAGCRYSDSLTQKIIDAPGVSEIDYTLKPVTLERPEAEDEQKDLYEGETEDQNLEEDKDTPDYDDESEPDAPEEATEQQEYDNTADGKNGKATDGGSPDGGEGDATQANANAPDRGIADEEGEGENKGAGDNEGGNPVEGSPVDTDDGDEQSPRGRTIEISLPDETDDPQPEQGNNDNTNNNQNTGEDNDNTWNNNPSDNGNGAGDDDNKQGSTYADGTYDQIPSVGKIAAAGPYATIVQSLGGKGALAAAPQQWLDSLPAGAYANHSELTDVKGVSSWGDGSTMTNAAVQAIIESGAEVVLTSNTYNVMNQDQADAFNDKGIDVLQLPDIGVHNAKDADIVLTVQVVGELLRDAGASIQFDARKAAATWKATYHDYTIESVKGLNGGFSCLTQGDVWGNPYHTYSYIYQGSSADALRNQTSWISQRNYICCYVDDWDISRDYALSTPINPSGYANSGVSSFDVMDYYFQCSGITRYETVSSVNADLLTDGNRFLAVAFCARYDEKRLKDSALPVPIVIARDEGLAEKIAAQAGAMTSIVLPDGTSNRGFNLGYNYQVWVMPAGIDGSWYDGTFESFLIAPWAYSLTSGNGTSYADELTSQFYSTFFRPGDGDVASLVGGYGRAVDVICTK